MIAGGTALAVHPLRVHFARVVDRLLYGDLHDPYRALQRLAEQTHAAPDADAVLAGMAASVAASLRVPWSSVEAGGHVGCWGDGPGGAATTSVELSSGAACIGTITVAPGPGRRLRNDELALLADLGRHGGVAVQAVLLTESVRAGRQRLVVAREEERRRLRRDLHDGVGPTLAGLTMQLGAVRPLVRSDPDAVAERLGDPAGRGAGRAGRRAPPLARAPPAGARRARPRRGAPAARGFPRPAGAVHRRRRPAAPARRGRGGRLPDRRRVAAQRRPARRHPRGRASASGSTRTR